MIRFGPAGNSDEFYEQGYKHTVEQMEWLFKKGLNAFEYSFGKGVRLNDKTAENIGQEAKKYDIALSCHAPYYINLASNDPERIQKNNEYIIKSCIAAKNMGADRIVIHPGSCSTISREAALEFVISGFQNALDEIKQFDGITLCCETMGKKNQFGTEEEVATVCTRVPEILPAIDFGHIYARTQGGIKSKQDFRKIIDLLFENLGNRAKYIHIHFSKIEYTAMGEKKHLTFDDDIFGPDFEPLMELFREYEMEPRVICESKGTMAKDALKMKQYYEELK